jgi:hypothetical protein
LGELWKEIRIPEEKEWSADEVTKLVIGVGPGNEDRTLVPKP